MSQFIPNVTAESLKDKVVLVTGGANGIGANLVEYLCQNGAYVCFGDKAAAAGNELSAKIVAASASSPTRPQAIFYETDVTDYKSVLGLFDTALETYGHIDHVVAAAGITEIGNWFDPELTMEDIRQPATTKVIDVNLNGALYTARIASVYLKQNRPEGTDRSITLISSIAGFKESPGLFVYQASKHGVLGLMRSLRLYLPKSGHRLRINAICPWMTHTGMVSGIQDAWFKAGLPVNAPKDVAMVAAGLIVDEKLNGKSMYVEGGRAWEIEDNIDRLEPQWLGEEASKSLAKGQAVLEDGSDWIK
ncbi:hypothetical protein N7495_007773 [Penicillium taxi]|uniref:uncharacterized protein n=1 Tax=Penicillium taxi TaxID=168475 RepID=UPI0025455DB6|nr:uncharacterized protein N7495_007773 [Penicillium taxi]KAJ5887732.1 hypothetical protein N7495_007773 [Penicillium taxi]